MPRGIPKKKEAGKSAFALLDIAIAAIGVDAISEYLKHKATTSAQEAVAAVAKKVAKKRAKKKPVEVEYEEAPAPKKKPGPKPAKKKVADPIEDVVDESGDEDEG